MKKGSQNDVKIHEKSPLGRPWVDFLTPWGDFRGILCDLGAPGRFQDALAHQQRNSKVDFFFAKMNSPRIEFSPRLGRHGASKSHFFAKSRHKIAKKPLREGIQKKIEKVTE